MIYSESWIFPILHLLAAANALEKGGGACVLIPCHFVITQEGEQIWALNRVNGKAANRLEAMTHGSSTGESNRTAQRFYIIFIHHILWH